MIKITINGKKAWVTFNIKSNEGDKVELIGSWDSWEKKSLMKVKKDGHSAITKVLVTDKHYEFGYLINDKIWMADDSTDFI
ncbi:MAG: hypothetical protein JJV88_04845, partial [Sulfurovum sp.]|nr:hypothetical protein [Sulfurovaceae bacterium]